MKYFLVGGYMGKTNVKYTIHEVRSIFKNNGCTLISDEYKNNKQKLEIVAQCGHRTTCRLNDFVNGKSRLCNECTVKKRISKKKHSFEFVKKTFEENGCILLSNEYINQKSSLDYVASCGHKYRITFKNFLKGSGLICYDCSMRGENNPKYKKDKTDEERKNDRSHELYRNWRISVYERDSYTCQKCFDNKGGNLECHHIESHNWAIDKRFDVDNGITLCKRCHKDFHSNFGFGDNTKEQFNEWMSNF